MTTVKQIYELNENDLANYEIWEYLTEDHPDAIDECSVIGVKSFDDIVAISWVSIKCIGSNGHEYKGLASPVGDSIHDRQAIIFINGKRLMTWTGVIRPNISVIEKELGIRLSDLFPIKYRFSVIHRRISNVEVKLTGIGYIPSGKRLEEYDVVCA